MKEKVELIKEMISTLSPNELEEIIKDIDRRLRNSKFAYSTGASKKDNAVRLKDAEEGKNMISHEEHRRRIEEKYGYYLK